MFAVAPEAPVIQPATDLSGVTAAEAMAGLITISNTTAGNTITVLVGHMTTHPEFLVTRSFVSTGTNDQVFALRAEDVTTLGDGFAFVWVTQTDSVGNRSAAPFLDFLLDTVAPEAPLVHAATDLSGVTAAEATSGLITIWNTTAGNTITAIVARGQLSVTRSFVSTGTNDQVFALRPEDLITLGDGWTNVTVTQTDPAGNTSAGNGANFLLDTVAPEAPTDIALSVSSIAENAGPNAVVGTLSTTDPDLGTSFTYTLVSGTGDTDNAAFNILGDRLRATTDLDYERLRPYSVRVRTTDANGMGFEKPLFVTATDINEEPTDITLSASRVDENLPEGTVVGSLRTLDQDLNITVIPLPVPASFAYSFISGTGGDHNHLFRLTRDGYRDVDELLTAGPMAPGTFSIRLRSTDPGGLFVERVFTITVVDVNDAPTGLFLFTNVIPENQPAGVQVGTLSTADPDVSNNFTYALVAGEGSADNASFTIVGNELRANASFNYEARSSYTVRIRSTDQGGLWREASFTIAVTNVAEPLSIAAVIPPVDGIYRVGAVLRFILIASEPVTVVGRPTVNLRIGTATRVATFESAVGNQLVFAYRVVTGDHDLDGVVLGAVINKLPRGVSIRDTQGRNMPLGLPPVNFSSVRIDNKGPLSVGLVAVPRTGIYRFGETLEFRVSFSESVVVTGVPQILFNTGAGLRPRQAIYAEGSGSTQLVFRYVVRPGDVSPRGIAMARAITLGSNSGVRDVAGNGAELGLRFPSTAGIRLLGTGVVPLGVLSQQPRSARQAAFARYEVLYAN